MSTYAVAPSNPEPLSRPAGRLARFARALGRVLGLIGERQDLRAAVAEQTEEIRADLTTAGCAQEVLLSCEEARTAAEAYATIIGRLRALRLRALLECHADPTPALSPLAKQDLELCKGSEQALLQLQALVADDKLKDNVRQAQVIRLVQQSWVRDAADAVEELEVQRLVRTLIPLVTFLALGLQFVQHWTSFFDDFQFQTIGHLLNELIGNLANFFTSVFLMCSFFGLLGAILSIWFDRGFLPRTPHWRLVRRAERITRCWGGILVGWLTSALAPVLFGVPAGGVASTSAAAPSPEIIIRLYLFALVFGFSQDAFIKRIRSFEPQRS